MKAKVQYNDFIGTVAADLSDYYFNSINEYLKQHYPFFDWNRYFCIGCEFFTSYGQYLSVSFICRDLIDKKLHRLLPENEFSLEVFFELFKRFSIVLGNGIEDEDVVIDDTPIILKH